MWLLLYTKQFIYSNSLNPYKDAMKYYIISPILQNLKLRHNKVK